MQGCASTVVNPFAMPTRFEYVIETERPIFRFAVYFA